MVVMWAVLEVAALGLVLMWGSGLIMLAVAATLVVLVLELGWIMAFVLLLVVETMAAAAAALVGAQLVVVMLSLLAVAVLGRQQCMSFMAWMRLQLSWRRAGCKLQQQVRGLHTVKGCVGRRR